MGFLAGLMVAGIVALVVVAWRRAVVYPFEIERLQGSTCRNLAPTLDGARSSNAQHFRVTRPADADSPALADDTMGMEVPANEYTLFSLQLGVTRDDIPWAPDDPPLGCPATQGRQGPAGTAGTGRDGRDGRDQGNRLSGITQVVSSE